MTSSRLSPLLLAAAIATAACEEAPSDNAAARPPAPVAAKLITTLTLEQGHTLQFWDASSAAIVVTEDGFAHRSSAVSELPKRPATALELYEVLAPGRAVPDSLVEAQARVTEFGLSHPKRPGAPKANEGIRQAAVNYGYGDEVTPPGTPYATDMLCSATWFRQAYCTPRDGHYFGLGCSTLRINGGYATEWYDVDETHSAVCAYRGTLTFRAWVRTWWTWDTIPAAAVPAGRAHWLFTFQHALDYDYSEGIDQGDIGYHRALYTCPGNFVCPF